MTIIARRLIGHGGHVDVAMRTTTWARMQVWIQRSTAARRRGRNTLWIEAEGAPAWLGVLRKGSPKA